MAKKSEPTTKAEFATVILSMRYGELLAVCEALANDRHAERNAMVTAEDFASLLHAWAAAQ